MANEAEDDRSEPKAKAALLHFLRSTGRTSNQTSVTAELILGSYSVRADLAVCDGQDLHCYEIKTARDTLTRLDRQIAVYNSHSDFVTVVAASRHINAVLSRVPANVGVYEIVGFDSPGAIRVVREAERSPIFDADAMLSLMPVKDMKLRLQIAGKLRRPDVLAEASRMPTDWKKQAALAFFRERYGPNSKILWRATRKRMIRPGDLEILRRWRRKEVGAKCDVFPVDAVIQSNSDVDVYRHVGRSFGPVPDELKALLSN